MLQKFGMQNWKNLSLSPSSTSFSCAHTYFRGQRIIFKGSGSFSTITYFYNPPNHYYPYFAPRLWKPPYHFLHQSYIMAPVTRSQAYQGPITRFRSRAEYKTFLNTIVPPTSMSHAGTVQRNWQATTNVIKLETEDYQSTVKQVKKH